MNQFGIALAWCAVQVTVLSTGAAIVCMSLRRSSPALRSWTVLLALLAIPCLTALALCPIPSWFDARSGTTVTAVTRDDSQDRSNRLPDLGGYSPQGYNAVFADGSVQFISKDVSKDFEQRLIMSQDGQPTNRGVPR